MHHSLWSLYPNHESAALIVNPPKMAIPAIIPRSTTKILLFFEYQYSPLGYFTAIPIVVWYICLSKIAGKLFLIFKEMLCFFISLCSNRSFCVLLTKYIDPYLQVPVVGQNACYWPHNDLVLFIPNSNN